MRVNEHLVTTIGVVLGLALFFGAVSICTIYSIKKEEACIKDTGKVLECKMP